jgi:exopolyphosphatase/pppGpp-phosphohydrolase
MMRIIICVVLPLLQRDAKKTKFRVQKALNISIHIKEGEEEALLILEAIRHLLNEHKNYLHVDVGGGSTEVSLYAGQKKCLKLFLGSIRSEGSTTILPLLGKQ